MTLMSVIRAVALAALIAAGFTAVSAADSAQDKPAEARPAETKPADAKPAAEPAPNDCVTDTTGFQMHGKSPAYVTTLENKCERRLRCRLDLYVTTAKGPTQGHTTLVLGPHAAGEAAKKSYVLRVKMMSGTAQGARECSAF